MIKKNKTFADLAFYVGFPDLLRVMSSTQNINVAKKLTWGLKQKICKEEIVFFKNMSSCRIP